MIERPEGGQAYLAPRDPAGGGTWIGVNQRGLIAALLNHYAAGEQAPPTPVSRGLLVRGILGTCSGHADVAAFLESSQRSSFRPFLLFALDPESRARLWTWDGCTLQRNTREPGSPVEPRMITTSSIRSDECQTYRRDLFRQAGADHRHLFSAHHSTAKGDPALGPLMSRPDAATESLTEIEVTGQHAHLTFRYVRGERPTLGPPIRHILPIAEMVPCPE